MNFLNKTKKGQPAIEALMVLSISIVFIIPLAVLFYSSTGLRLESLNYMEAKALSQHISDTAGEVWYAGKGARKTLLVSYPSGMTELSLSGDEISCPLIGGVPYCPQEIKYLGREIVINIQSESGANTQLISVSPAPVKNRYTDPSQMLGAIQTVDGTFNSGLVVLIFKNEGPYVNVVRYTPKVQY